MRTFIKSSFLWQFALGFTLGAAGLYAVQPVDVDAFGTPIATMQSAR